METPATLGQRVRARRKALKLTQIQLAKKVGMDQSTLSEIENDRYTSSVFAPRLAEALKVTAIWLADGKGAMDPPPPAGVTRLPLGRHADPDIAAAIAAMEATDEAGRKMALGGILAALSGHKSAPERPKRGRS